MLRTVGTKTVVFVLTIVVSKFSFSFKVEFVPWTERKCFGQFNFQISLILFFGENFHAKNSLSLMQSALDTQRIKPAKAEI